MSYTWCMTVDYRLLNQAAAPMAAVLLDIVTLLERLEAGASAWHTVTTLVNAAFSIPIAEELQERFAFSWEGQQYTFTVLPQGYLHSPTICHGIVAQHLGECSLSPKCKLFHHIDDILLTAPTEQDVGEARSRVVDTMRGHGWEINPQKVQGPETEVKFLGIIWQGPCQIMPEAVKQTVLHIAEPQKKVDVQRSVRLLGYWHQFIPHLALIVKTLV